MKILTIIMLCFSICLTCPSYAEEDGQISRILYINSYHPGYVWSDNIESGIRSSLESAGKKFRLSVEYLDTRRFSASEWQSALAEIIIAKYKNFPQDLIIVSDNAAFDFAIRNRSRFFPETPLVFCGYNNFTSDKLQGFKNITGVNENTDILGLVKTALSIQPETRTMVFILSTIDVSSAGLSAVVENSVVPMYQDRYRVILLKDETLPRIRATLARLPEDAILFLTGINSDMPVGQAMLPVESARLILAACPVPAYTLWDYHLGLGVLGGQILTGYQQGKAAGEMAVQILNGKKASSIPVLMESPVQNIFDYGVMKRFGIKAKDLPENSTIINRPETFYSRYKKLVWAISGVTTVLTLFIIILSVNIFRRVRAEKELLRHQDHLEKLVVERTAELTETNTSLKNSEDRFRSLSDAAFEGLVVIEDGLIIDYNAALAKMFGYSRSEFSRKALINLIAPEKHDDFQQKILSGSDAPHETLGMKQDGTIFPVEIRSAMLMYQNKQMQVAAVRDLTGKKNAEREIYLLRGILPICMRCKKIRDDEGYWNQLEAYIQKNSGAQFSHGLCPDCFKVEMEKL